MFDRLTKHDSPLNLRQDICAPKLDRSQLFRAMPLKNVDRADLRNQIFERNTNAFKALVDGADNG